MPESILTILKLCFLAVLYLFLARVLRAVWVEIFADRKAVAEDIAAQQARANAAAVAAGVGGTLGPVAHVQVSAKQGRRGSRAMKRSQRKDPTHWALRVVEPPERKGVKFALGQEITIGRAPGCSVSIEDTFASQLHARVFLRDGVYYVEDLGSTNGTLLNRKPVHGPIVFRKGDRVQVGGTVLELTA